MVVLSSESTTVAGGEGVTRHRSSGRETLDIPDIGSGLTARLPMLNLAASQEQQQQQQQLHHDAPARQGNSVTTVEGTAAPNQRQGWGVGQGGLNRDGPTLMEQMMAEAMAAKEQKDEDKRQEQRENTKTNFGGGLKKGFLSGSPASSTPRKTKKGSSGKQGSRTGSSVTESVSRPATVAPVVEAKESMPVVSGQASLSGGLEFDVSAKPGGSGSGLVLSEVQEAMKSSTSLGGDHGHAGGGSVGGRGGDWLTPELLDKISKKPRLAAMLTDPRFSRAMELMSTSPQDALGMFASSPEARESFTELMALLADHFTGIGEAADKQATAEEADRQRVAAGPLAQEAIRKAKDGVGVSASPVTEEETADVERVLQQPELRELLMDPGMQRVLQECGEPRALARYMRHKEYGPKLQLMARAGLISFGT